MIETASVAFDYICIIVSMVLCYNANPKHSKISFILMAWFVLSEISYSNFFVEYQKVNQSFIYLIYGFITIPSAYMLKKLNSHIFILLVFGTNLLLLATTVLYFVYDFVPEIVYNTYKYIAALISLSVIYYMVRLNKKGGPFGGCTNKVGFHRVFWMRWNDFRRVYLGSTL